MPTSTTLLLAALLATLWACGGTTAVEPGGGSEPTPSPHGDAPSRTSTPLLPGAARAYVISTYSEGIAGPAASAQPGDIRLENEHFAVIVRSQEHRGTLSSSGGMIIDAAPNGGTDGLGEIVPIFDADGHRMADFRIVDIDQDGARGGPAIVRASGFDPHDQELRIDVDYVLEPGARFLRIITSLTNRGRNHYRDLPLGRLVKWGTLRAFVPGAGADLAGRRTRSEWVGGDGPESSVLLTTVGGLMEGIHGRDWSMVGERSTYVAPGATIMHEVRLIVGDGMGMAAAVDQLHRHRKTVVGRVRGTVVERGSQTPISGATVVIANARGHPENRAHTDQWGRFEATLSPGQHSVEAVAVGRNPSMRHSCHVNADRAVELTLALDPPGKIVFDVTDSAGRPLPVRIRLAGVDSTPDPWLGPPNGTPAAGNDIIAVGGAGAQAVPPGRYRGTVTAGPMYDVWQGRIDVAGGQTSHLTAVISRHIDPVGWFALDPRVHTRQSSTSSTSLEARIASCVVEGLDGIVVASDVGQVAMTPVRPQAADGPTASVAGWSGEHAPLEVFRGSTVSLPAAGRFLALPVAESRTPPLNLGRRPEHLLANLKQLPGAPLVGVVAPRVPTAGYFERFQLDLSAEALPRGGFSLAFDLLEVAVGTSRTHVDRALADYVALVERGHRVIPLGVSGADTIAGDHCGLPRTWVHVEGRPDASALKRAMGAGDVTVSYGPLLDLEVNGVRPGQTVPAAIKHEIKVRVRAASWNRPERLAIWVDGQPWKQVKLPTPRAARPKPLDITHQFVLPGTAGHRWLMAVADGPGNLGRIYGMSGASVRPLAFTGAIRLESLATQ